MDACGELAGRPPNQLTTCLNAIPAPCSYGALGYEQLFLKESGAPGLLLGVALLVGTCGGELPVFASTAWWLPKLGE